MDVSRQALAVALVVTALAGCAGEPSEPAAPAGPSPPAARPAVVVAVIDTGMNLYHEQYRRDPSVPPPAGVPARTAIPLTFGGKDFEASEKADHDALMQMERETLYTFPGTKVLAAISFQDRADDWPLVLDHPERYTHGTMTTSRAVGSTISIGGDDPDIWLVIVQGFSAESVRWAAEQDWIDVISISAGISPNSIVPVVPNLLDSDGIPSYNLASHRKPFFASSGNGVGNAGVLGFPAATRGSSGVPDAISVGANDNDRMSQWHNQGPYIAADGCGNPAAEPGHLAEVTNSGGGTSSATPFSAGGGARMLLEARRLLGDTAVGPRAGGPAPEPGAWSSGRPEDASVVLAQGTPTAAGPLADGAFTLLEFKDVLYHTALAVATDDESDGVACPTVGASVVPDSAAPQAARFPFDGYGEVNHASIAAALAVLRGEGELPSRPAEDAAYHQQRDVKMQVVGDSEG